MTSILKALFSFMVLGFIGSSLTAADRPNVLFLFADDFSYEALGYLGKTDIETPNLDRLARRGVTFTHAYNMGSWSGAVCIASRNMLLSGRSVWRAEKIAKSTEALREAGQLWPGWMKSAGYDTYMTGKWHIEANANKSFDVVRHVRPGMPDTVEASYNRPIEGQPNAWSSADPAIGGFWKGGKHWSEVAADDAVDYIHMASNKLSPFFMYIAFNAPHDPRQAPQSYLDKYPLERIQVPRNYANLYPFKDAIGCGPDLRDERLGPFPRTEYAVKVHRREYYALISHLDAQIGRILEALDKSGQAEKTWIFFTADHGLAVGHHGLFGKQNMYDHSLRVPFIVAGPQLPADTKIDSPIYLQDAMATSLELAGVAKPETCEFQSIASMARGESQSATRQSIYAGYLQLQRSVIKDGWKLILYPKAAAARLYHLSEDPDELKDLASDPSFATKKHELFEELLSLQRSLDDKLDLRATFSSL